jgi:hypothetical protein
MKNYNLCEKILTTVDAIENHTDDNKCTCDDDSYSRCIKCYGEKLCEYNYCNNNADVDNPYCKNYACIISLKNV